MEFIKKYKKVIAIILLVAVLGTGIGVFTYYRMRRAPELDDVKERFIYLIEESKGINVIFFGEGLPVYIRESELSEEKFVYIGEQNKGYERVMEQSPYLMLDEIKTAAERVYSSAYCDQLFESGFDGVVVEGVTLLQYTEISEWLYQSTAKDVLMKSERVYLYDTMKIVRPSNKEYVNVEIESFLIDKPDVVQTERLSFIYEDGNWYLDTPTY